jgi:hypothetical protein
MRRKEGKDHGRWHWRGRLVSGELERFVVFGYLLFRGRHANISTM